METIVCPHCETNLKLNSQIAPGRRVRCPKCSTAFVPETEEEHVEIFVDSPDAKETHRRCEFSGPHRRGTRGGRRAEAWRIGGDECGRGQ